MDNKKEEQREENETESEPEKWRIGLLGRIREDTLKKLKTTLARKIEEETKKEIKTKPKKRSKRFLNTLTKTKNAMGNQRQCKNRKFGNTLSKCWKVPSC